MPFAKVGNIKIHYLREGVSGGTPVLMICGLSLDKSLFAEVSKNLRGDIVFFMKKVL